MQFEQSIQVFKNFDIFGQQIQLNFKGDDSYQTALGGSLSLTILAIIAFTFQQNIIDYLKRNEVILDVQTLFDANPDIIQFQESNFMFALAIEQDHFTSNPYFNITLKQRLYTRQINGTIIKQDQYIDLIPCTLDRFQQIFGQNNFTNQFIQLGLSEWLCPQQNYTLQISGGYTSDIFEFIKITVTECSNDTSHNSFLTWKPECASSELRQQHLQTDRSFRIKMYMTNTIINPQQSKNISQVFLDDELFFSFLINTGTETDVYFQKYNITTNQNIIPYIEDNEELQYNIKQQGDFRVSQVQNNGQSYSAIYLRRSPYTYLVKRNFQDLTDLLSYLGGFANIIIILFGFIITIYNKSQFMIDIANQVYDFPVTQHQTNELLKRREVKTSIAKVKQNTIIAQYQQLQSPKQQQQQQQHSFVQNIKQQLGITDRNSYLTSQIQNILNRSKPILFNCKFILYQLFCQRFFYDRNSILLQKAINKINKDLDLCVIIDKVKEINLLKELLLTEDQLVLFDFAPKEIITDEQQQLSQRNFARKTLRQFNSQTIQNNTLNTYYKLFRAYDSIQQSLQQNDKINEKLIEKLGQEVRDIFEISHFINQNELNDDFQCDSVNSDPPFITSIDQFKVNFKI